MKVSASEYNVVLLCDKCRHEYSDHIFFLGNGRCWNNLGDEGRMTCDCDGFVNDEAAERFSSKWKPTNNLKSDIINPRSEVDDILQRIMTLEERKTDVNLNSIEERVERIEAKLNKSVLPTHESLWEISATWLDIMKEYQQSIKERMSVIDTRLDKRITNLESEHSGTQGRVFDLETYALCNGAPDTLTLETFTHPENYAETNNEEDLDAICKNCKHALGNHGGSGPETYCDNINYKGKVCDCSCFEYKEPRKNYKSPHVTTHDISPGADKPTLIETSQSTGVPFDEPFYKSEYKVPNTIKESTIICTFCGHTENDHLTDKRNNYCDHSSGCECLHFMPKDGPICIGCGHTQDDHTSDGRWCEFSPLGKDCTCEGYGLTRRKT